MLDRISLTDIPRVTLVLVATSVLTFVAMQMGRGHEVQRLFMISGYVIGLSEVMNGEWWRLVTPIFVHFGILHILFNMIGLLVFAGAIEKKYGKVYFILMVLVFAITSNVGQFMYSGPLFGGMSGVVYGIFGYLWMQSKFNPWSTLMLHDQEIGFIMILFVASWLGLLGNIANMAHTIGLLSGLAWGYGHAVYANRRRRR
ncbi:Rhomboid protease GlpG [hydrothermal vent metagenome]|uniref:Rhomboid protease GlpG n=1 Tax=hydrothermal vent metagenome TaxID=652676 RepID=A0A3B0YUI5_9ZZZZ